ncbi:MAG: D-sedoheptulose 7-phosphate isomerase [Candidatus Latescibacter sp.]|nr:D-sedoheptulose 7-phosphate isomerase [Candidatus Latescibacter sp.]
MTRSEEIIQAVSNHSIMIQTMLSDVKLVEDIERAALMIVECINRDGTVLIFGNGGSAADAQHFAAELVGRFAIERRGLQALALSTDTSVMTSIANDYGFEEVFARQVEALGRPGDVTIPISTSGNSPNILRAIDASRKKGMKVIGLTGGDGGSMRSSCDLALVVPSAETPRIQEAHALIYHILCGLIEKEVCGTKTT